MSVILNISPPSTLRYSPSLTVTYTPPSVFKLDMILSSSPLESDEISTYKLMLLHLI